MLPASEPRQAALRDLLRHVHHEGGLNKPGRVNWDLIADSVGVSRDQLNRFLTQIGNSTELAERHQKIGERLLPILQKKELPRHIRAMVSDVYGDYALAPQTPVIKTARVLQHKAIVPAALNAREIIRPLEGLSVMVRPANEVVPAPREDDKTAVARGWSISLVNVPPEHIQPGDHHPLFKILQRGVTTTVTTIEGIVIARPDRIALEGMTLGENRSVSASIAIPHEPWQYFRTNADSGAAPVSPSGIVLGVASGGSSFATLFELYAIGQTTLKRGATTTERNAFNKAYSKARNAIGVRDLDETLTVLASLGITADRKRLLEMLERAFDTPILTAF